MALQTTWPAFDDVFHFIPFSSTYAMIPFSGVLTLIFWGLLALLVLILFAIARFYQVTSGQKTHYRWFILPAILLILGAARYALLNRFAGDTPGDLLIIAGSVVLFMLARRLFQLMIGGRR